MQATTTQAPLPIDQCAETVTQGDLKRTDVEPVLQRHRTGVRLLLRNQGEYGTFDVPYIRSQVIYADAALVAVLVSYHGTETHGPMRSRHVAKGQFYRFYRGEGDGVWMRVTWRQLPQAQRDLITFASEISAPLWAKRPGGASQEAIAPPAPDTTVTSYKLVQVDDDGRFASAYRPDVEYVLGEELTQEAVPGHRGGFYSYPDHEVVMRLFHKRKLFPERCYVEGREFALVECEIWGTIIPYTGSKWASSHIRPRRVLSRFTYRGPSSIPSRI